MNESPTQPVAPPGPLHITSIQIENVKRVKAVRLIPTATGLTVIGGRNEQGKTSILDALAWALGGGRKAPTKAKRDGSMSEPYLCVKLSNGITVERKGKNSVLTVTDPEGKRAGQSLLDAFVSELALDLPKFMESSSRDKAQTLLQILGIGDQLTALEKSEKALYDERHALRQVATQKRKHADELPEHPEAPDRPMSISALLTQQQAVLATNGENQRKRDNYAKILSETTSLAIRIEEMEAALLEAKERHAMLALDCSMAKQDAADLQDQSTAELEAQIANFETINAMVHANQQKSAAQDEATEHEQQVTAKTEALEAVRAQRLALLDSAPLPLPGLTVEDAELVYMGQKWDGMSSSQQLRVSVAIVRALNPNCSFVLMDKLEQMDLATLAEFGAWLVAEGLQAIATRVSTGAECTLIIEDGLPEGQTYADVTTGVNGSAAPAVPAIEF